MNFSDFWNCSDCGAINHVGWEVCASCEVTRLSAQLVSGMNAPPDQRKARRWTQEELDGTAAGKKRSKGRYGNVRKPVHDGIKFDSKREMLRYMDLKLLEKAGHIRDIKAHPKYPITIAGIEIRYCGSNRHMTYSADFAYQRFIKAGIWVPIVEDVKMQSGHRTGVYKIKRALMRAMGYEIEEY